MERSPIQGILLKSDKQIQRESELLEAKNLLQMAYATYLNFQGQDEGSDLIEFINKYGKAIGDMIEDHPTIVESYEKLLKEGKESEFDFGKMETTLKSYLPTLH